ncbi:hypothetical protein CI102_10806 [Trichoderma harzianum]|nr:hypothetical protein CI102_10806 [Trichoderma harzianum]
MNKLFDSRRDGTEALVCSFLTGIGIFALSSSFILFYLTYLTLFYLILGSRHGKHDKAHGVSALTRGNATVCRFQQLHLPVVKYLMPYSLIPFMKALTSLIRSFPHVQLPKRIADNGYRIPDSGKTSLPSRDLTDAVQEAPHKLESLLHMTRFICNMFGTCER